MNKFLAAFAVATVCASSVEAGEFFLKVTERNISLSACVTATYLVGIDYKTEVEIISRDSELQIAKIEIPMGTLMVTCNGAAKTMIVEGKN